jgi:hypothetical protein
MKNFYDPERYIKKSDLAEYADVSPRTFARYLEKRRGELAKMGLYPEIRTFPPYGVEYVCEDYCIDLPPELQDQKRFRNHHCLKNVIIDDFICIFSSTPPRRLPIGFQNVVPL